MAHFAKIGLNNDVIDVLVVSDVDCRDAAGNEDEEVGRKFLERLTGWPTWKKCSYNTHHGKYYYLDSNDMYVIAPDDQQSKAFRLNYPGKGFKYDPFLDGFISQQPYRTWTVNDTTGNWDAPVPRPADDVVNGGNVVYKWSVANNNWENKGAPGVQGGG